MNMQHVLLFYFIDLTKYDFLYYAYLYKKIK